MTATDDQDRLCEAVQWGSQDWLTGARESECPYDADHWTAEVWLEAFKVQSENATKWERIAAGVARLFRTRIF
jgi:ribosome modulation factor